MAKLIDDTQYFKQNSNLTQKEQEVIKLNYRFRFFNSNQIQALLNHKSDSRLNGWLVKLTKEGYLIRDYKRIWGEGNKPAVYGLDKKGAKYLLNILKIKSRYLSNIAEEENVSSVTVNHSIKALDFYLAIRDYAISKGHSIDYYTERDLDNEDYKVILKPDGYFKYITKKGSADCFIEIDLETETRATFRQKIAKYLDYYYSDKWKKHFKEFPVIGVVCITQTRLENLLLDTEEKLKEYNNPPVEIKFTTFERIKDEGLGSDIWKVTFSEEFDSLL